MSLQSFIHQENLLILQHFLTHSIYDETHIALKTKNCWTNHRGNLVETDIESVDTMVEKLVSHLQKNSVI